MKIDTMIGPDLPRAADRARDAERSGYTGIWAPEMAHDPFLPLIPAAAGTTTIEIGTGIAVAFARNPMTLAVVANDLQALSGRFNLGLGSQVRAHITRRFSMEWSQPAKRMRELVLAMRAIWRTWNEGAPLNFEGDFYTHTLMVPYFDPGPNPHGMPKVFLAGVGTHMTEVAGEVADGFLGHPFSTSKYLREVTIPAIERGAQRAGRSSAHIEISGPGFVVTGHSEEAMAVASASVRRQIAFYGSTRGYRDVLELHGWGDLQDDAQQLVKKGRLDDLASLVDDEVLETFAIVAEPDQLADRFVERYGDVVDRVTIDAPYEPDPAVWSPLLAAMRQSARS